MLGRERFLQECPEAVQLGEDFNCNHELEASGLLGKGKKIKWGRDSMERNRSIWVEKQ